MLTVKQLEVEKRAVLAEIDEAFADVTRDGGISWRHAQAIDCYESENMWLDDKERETDRHWNEKFLDAEWNPEPGVGGFGFLDAIGWRYYLPAAMKRCIAVDPYALQCQYRLDVNWDPERLRNHSALLNGPQRRCIARFLRCMDEIQLAEWHAFTPPMVPDEERRHWKRALESHWAAVELEE